MPVGLALELDVEVEELEPDPGDLGTAERHGTERGGGSFLERVLQARLAARLHELRGLVVGGQFRGHATGARLGRDAVAPAVPPRDVVGVDERDGRAPGLRAPLLRKPLVELGDDQRIHAPALAGPAVGGGVHAAGEAVALERAFADRRRPVVVAVGEVPLAQPARVVAVLAQHRPPRRESRIECAPTGDHAARLMGVEAREQGRSRGRAVVGGRVMVLEADRSATQAAQVGGQALVNRGRRGPLGSAADLGAKKPARRAAPGCELGPRRAY